MIRFTSTTILAVFTLLVVSCATPDAATSSAIESYDLYYAPTFFRPKHFTIERHPDTYVLREQAYRGAGGYNPQKIGRSKTKRLSVDDWNRLTAIIQGGAFWTDSVTDLNEPIPDGTEIIFEGKRPGQQKKIRQYGEYFLFLEVLRDKLEKL